MKSIGGTILLVGSFLVVIGPPAHAASVLTYHSSFGARAQDIDSVEVLFDFSGGSSWRYMADSVSRFSDNGRAEDSNNAPDVLPPVDSAGVGFLPAIFTDVVMPPGAASHVKSASDETQDPSQAGNAAGNGTPLIAGSANLPTADNTGGGATGPGLVQNDFSDGNVVSLQPVDPNPPAPALTSGGPLVPAAVAVPEPGVWLLMVIGSIGVVLGTWRKRRTS